MSLTPYGNRNMQIPPIPLNKLVTESRTKKITILAFSLIWDTKWRYIYIYIYAEN